jgi:HPt (histidine-containing phosphotransfer) domain-containing protein
VAEGVTEAAGAKGLPVWDRGSFDGFTDWMPRHRVAKLLDLFRKQAGAAIESLPAAASDAAWEKEAHDLLYSAGTLGFVRLAESCRRMQALIRKGGSPTTDERCGLLDAMAGALDASDITIDAPSP